MKKIFIIAAAAMLFTACRHENMEERAEREAREFTQKNCPVAISKEVTNDSLVFDKKTRTVKYYYTVSGPMGSAEAIAQKSTELRSGLLEGLKNNTASKRYKEEGFNFAYIYYSASDKGKMIYSTSFTPEEYNRK